MSSISKYMHPELVSLSFRAADKADAVMKICESIASFHKICDPKVLFDNIMNREALHSTAVGHGVAIPHARCDMSDTMTIAVAVCEKPIDCNAADRVSVNLIFVIVSPKNETASYLQLLSQIASLLNQEKVRKSLAEAKTPQEFIEIIKKNERK